MAACAAMARASEQVSCNRQRERERHGGVRYDDGRKQLPWEQQLHWEKFEILEAEQTKIEHMWSCIFQNCFNMIGMKLRF